MTTFSLRSLVFHGRLFFRFHAVPLGRDAADAVKEKPWFFAAALAIVAVLTFRPMAGGAPTELIASDLLREFLAVGIPAVAVTALSWPLRTNAVRRSLFYAARPGGPAALVGYGFFRLLSFWALASILSGWLLGVPEPLGILAWAVSGPLVCWGLAKIQSAVYRRHAAPTRRSWELGRRIPGIPAFFISHSPVFAGPFAATLAIAAWAVSGGAGFAWSDHPLAAGLLADFLWPTLFGLVWADVARIVPYRFFRMARAPWKRIAAIFGLPVLLQTAVVLIVFTAVSASVGDAVRTWVMNLAGTAFWFFFGLRWGPATMLTFTLSWAILVIGAVADRDWWWAWAPVLALGAVVGAVGWKRNVEDGMVEEEEDHG